jgi:hypothetical protein
MDILKVNRVADSKRAKLKTTLSELRARHQAEGRSFPRVDIALLEAYAGECVLREIASGPYAKNIVLKGGTMFRVWDRASSRPTRDVDVQIVGDVDPVEVQRWLVDAITTAEFAERTGIVVERDKLSLRPIKEGLLPDSLRIEGDVSLGKGERRETRIRLCLEVVVGAVPAEAVEMREVDGLLSKDAPFQVMCARAEWMIADKLHSIVSRGADNTRLKDWHDVLHLSRVADVDAERLRVLLSHVFEKEFRGDGMVSTADEALGLTARFATGGNGDAMAAQWVERRWKEFEGRAWRDGDETLGETAEAIGVWLEDIGVLRAASPTSLSFRALRDMAAAATRAQFEDAFRALDAVAGPDVDVERLAARLRQRPDAALLSSMVRAERAGWLKPWMREPTMSIGRALADEEMDAAVNMTMAVGM